ncbi:hypothetical protein [Micromonospora sp. NPDC049374]|uniref:hypothetical protein n=1 Tax=Micromonospora sp. NPDC049374 TaxID=3154352 RepID=UPI00341C5BBC
MLPVAPARPLWWLARWAARLLTGLAVAAAFTLGAWALPGHPAPADRLVATAPPVETAAPPASADWYQAAPLDLAAAFALVAPLDLVGLVTPTARCAGDSADPAGASTSPTERAADDHADRAGASATQPAACGRPGLTAFGGVAVGVTRGPAAPVAGARAARAPPHA